MSSSQEESSNQKGSGLSPSALKNFRHHPDIENFYRFLYENDLRKEALEILKQRFSAKQAASKSSKSSR
jgi:hypothetical protein